jgi:hypothetical protein
VIIDEEEVCMKALRIICGLAILAAQPVQTALADGDVELVENMHQLQYFAHKAGLAIDKKNKPLLGFYAHELEEYIEEAASVEVYDDHPIGQLVNTILVPPFEKFEAAAKADDWVKTSNAFDEVVQACNSCHQATSHGFIVIKRTAHNPFMQSFEPQSTQP